MLVPSPGPGPQLSHLLSLLLFVEDLKLAALRLHKATSRKRMRTRLRARGTGGLVPPATSGLRAQQGPCFLDYPLFSFLS
jgi:hypothetical protein